MMKRICAAILLLVIICGLCACAPGGDHAFRITFIDVGQGDAALVECDGHYMLIDGGDKRGGQAVYRTLEDRGVRQLDILAVSHLHEDHIGGLGSALANVTRIGKVLSNAETDDTRAFRDFERAISGLGAITVPAKGTQYKLGSATVEVLDVSAEEDNDSLVLLVTYRQTRYLFTGDIEKNAQRRVVDTLQARRGDFKGISLIKLPHHGAYNDELGFQDNELQSLFRVYDPTYFIISVGAGNQYGHPHAYTLKVIEDKLTGDDLTWADHVFRTDRQGSITVSSNGRQIWVGMEKTLPAAP